MVNEAVADGTAPDLSAWRPENAQNSFANTTVDSIVLEISHRHPQLRPGARTGVWSATKLATDAGGWRQINRAGHPMMWPIFWPDDTDSSNPANGPAARPGPACAPRDPRPVPSLAAVLVRIGGLHRRPVRGDLRGGHPFRMPRRKLDGAAATDHIRFGGDSREPNRSVPSSGLRALTYQHGPSPGPHAHEPVHADRHHADRRSGQLPFNARELA
jgi:hypothetical protein